MPFFWLTANAGILLAFWQSGNLRDFCHTPGSFHLPPRYCNLALPHIQTPGKLCVREQSQPVNAVASAHPVCASSWLSSKWSSSLLMVTIKLPILVCAKKLETSLMYRTKKQELKPMCRVETENGPISRGSQSGVYMVRHLGFTRKGRFWVESERVKGWWMEKVQKRKMGWDRHEGRTLTNVCI